MTRAALPCALALLCVSSVSAQERPELIALEGATVHPISGPPAKATVLIGGGRIVAIGQAPAPPGSQRVDLSGKHLYPGLIDAHTVLGLVEVSSVKGTNDQTEVGAINPNLRGEVGVNPDSELLPVARTGGVLLALTGSNSGSIAGTSALIATEGRTWEKMTVKAPVFLRVHWPRMRVDHFAPDEKKKQLEKREAALDGIEDAFRNARAYWQARAAASAPFAEQDVKWEAMGPVIRGDLPVSVEAETLSQIVAALDWARRERLNMVLVGGADAWRISDRLKAQRVPVILGRTFRTPRRNYEAVHTPFQNAARLHAAGVAIAFSTGANAFSAANARNLRDHAAMAVAHGLPEDAALRALTLGAAEILGVEDRMGSLEVGKQATLIAVDGPLFEFSSAVTHAWINGRSVSLRDRQRRLYERYR